MSGEEYASDTAAIVRGNLGSRYPDGSADGILGALEDLSRNRLPLPLTIRIHDATKVVREAISVREELRQALISQYDDAGEGWADPEDAPEELVEKVAELMAEPVELDLGEPLRLDSHAADIELSGRSYDILSAIGFVAV